MQTGLDSLFNVVTPLDNFLVTNTFSTAICVCFLAISKMKDRCIITLNTLVTACLKKFEYENTVMPEST